MANTQKTVMVTGGSQAIGAGLVEAFLHRGYSVVANSRNITKSGAFEASDQLASVDGSIAEAVTAAKIAEVARSRFQFIDALLNNAGIYFSKRLMDYTIDDLRSLFSVRVNAVAPGTVNTPMHKDHPKDFLKTLQPMGRIVGVKDIVDAIAYLTEAGQVTGEVLQADGGAHVANANPLGPLSEWHQTAAKTNWFKALDAA